jgi:ElaB/YqjD/DUF883 family membrane-anchored ribosome-binding protein
MSSANQSRTAERVGEYAEQAQQRASETMQNIKEMGSQAKSMAQDQYERMRERAGDYYEQGRERAIELEHSLEGQIREQPMRSVLIAAAVGFVLGLFFIRR